MSVNELIVATEKLTLGERTEFEREWRRRWSPEYEQCRQAVGQLLREGREAAERGEVIEGTEENLARIFDRATTTAAERRKNPAVPCPA